ncbi:hypothetical protein CGCVW01_v008007 [Colletotrichum viniferum]|nr:hypothetical protein CGCVW01_v008007 [Colletotrichum viniferum]
MVDQIYERNGSDVGLKEALINGMGVENGTRVADMMVSKNPSWSLDTTRFEIWSDIAEVAQQKGILIHPDNHVSKAIKHPNVASMSLRNELRPSYNITELADAPLQYNWQTYVGNMTAGAYAIHEANPDILISWSGMQFDENLSGLINQKNLMTHDCYHCDTIKNGWVSDPVYFDLDEHRFKDKVFWELHMSDRLTETVATENCKLTEAELYWRGLNALGIEVPEYCNRLGGKCESAKRITPVVFSEFGWGQDSSMLSNTFVSCMTNMTVKYGVNWMMWALPGIYRVREDGQFVLDTWSLTNDDFSGWQYE